MRHIITEREEESFFRWHVAAAMRAVESGEFRNLSHVFEQAARLMLREKLEGEKKA